MSKQNKLQSKSKPNTAIIVALIGLVGTIVAAIIAKISFPPPVNPTPTTGTESSAISVNTTIVPNGEIATPIPYGPTLLALDFTEVGNGSCDKYDPNLLGYEFHKYYIQPSSKGLMAVCT